MYIHCLYLNKHEPYCCCLLSYVHDLLPLYDQIIRHVTQEVEHAATRCRQVSFREEHAEHEALRDGCYGER